MVALARRWTRKASASARRLHHGEATTAVRTGREPGDRLELRRGFRADVVPDPRPATLAGDPAGLSEDAQVMRHRRLGDVMTSADVAGADRARDRELPENG